MGFSSFDVLARVGCILAAIAISMSVYRLHRYIKANEEDWLDFPPIGMKSY